MNILKVSCKLKNNDKEYEVHTIDFLAKRLQTVDGFINDDRIFFWDIEYIDFGTNRWYPNGK